VYNHLLYLLYWILNTLVLYLFFRIFPSWVVLGNFRLLPVEAAVYAGFWLTFFVWTMWDFIFIRGVKLEPESLAFSYFFFVNALGVWLVSRFAHLTGLGIANFGWAFLVGAVADLIQRFAWRAVLGRNKLSA